MYDAQENKRSQRMPGTLDSLLQNQSVQAWLSKSSDILWVKGQPGSGKSVFAAALIDDALQLSDIHTAVAFYYFQIYDTQTRSITAMLACLVKQLAVQSRACMERVQRFASEHPNVDLRKVPSDLVSSMASEFERTMIVIDGVDECEDLEACIGTLLSILGRSNSISLAFFSREAVLTSRYPRLDDAATLDLSLQVSTSVDIQLFINEKLSRFAEVASPEKFADEIDKRAKGK